MEEAGTSGFQVGDKVIAKDRDGVWMPARIDEQRGKAAQREMKIHFYGYAARFDEWLLARSGKVQKLQPGKSAAVAAALAQSNGMLIGLNQDGTYDIDKIVDKRRRKGGVEYQVRWAGYSEEWDLWEPARKLPAELIEEYEESCAAVEPAAAPKAAYTDGFVADSKDMTPWIDEIGRSASDKLAHLKDAKADLLVYKVAPFLPEMYVKFHQDIRGVASQLELNGDLDAHVTPRRPMSGQCRGSNVKDIFTIKSHDVIEKLMSDFNRLGTLAIDKRHGVAKVIRRLGTLTGSTPPPTRMASTQRRRRLNP